MADRPIVFSTPMVQAILRELAEPGTGKTQTRRMIQPQPEPIGDVDDASWHVFNRHGGTNGVERADVPRYQLDYLTPPWEPGDRAWVREGLKREEAASGILFKTYAADGAQVPHVAEGWHWKPRALPSRYMPAYASRYMPAYASRITLHVTDVRVMRLQETSEGDAIAEGARVAGEAYRLGAPLDGVMVETDQPHIFATPRAWYRELMDALHGAGFWDSNPWVYALTFAPELAHIDSARSA